MVKILEKLWLYLVFTTLLIIPFHSRYTSWLLGLIPLVSILIFIGSKRFYSSLVLLLPCIFFVLELIWVFFNPDNQLERLLKLDSQLALFFIPFSFMVVSPKLTEENTSFFYKVFILGNVIASLYAIGYAYYQVYQQQFPLTIYRLDLFLSQLHHHTYFSLNLLITMVLIISEFFRAESKPLYKIILITAMLVINLAIYIATSRIGVLLAVGLNLFFIWKIYKKYLNCWLTFLLIISSLCLIIFLIFQNKNFRRLNGGEQLELSVKLRKTFTENSRVLLWQQALHISLEHYMMGVGTNTFSEVLVENIETTPYKKQVLTDAHNQYIEVYFEQGIIGLFILFLLLFVPLIRSFKFGFGVGVALIILFAIMLFFESMLKRQWGVESIVFFYSIIAIKLKGIQVSTYIQNKIIRVTTIARTMNVLLEGQLSYLNTHFDVSGITSPGDEVEEICQREGIEIHTIRMYRQISIRNDFRAIVKMWNYLRKVKPAIVHTQTPKAGLVGILGARLAGVPFRIHMIVGLPLMELKGIKRFLVGVMDRFVYMNATHIISNSIGLRNYLLNNRIIPKRKLLVLGYGTTNGINLKHYEESEIIREKGAQLRVKYFGSEKVDVLLFVGRIVMDKGIHELVNAFLGIQKQKSAVKLVLVGKMEENNPIDTCIKFQIENNKDIVWVGYQKDIRPFLSMADIFVFPSYREGFPNVILQALSFNLCCIATDINGTNEVITHEKNGLLVSVKNTEVLRDSILRALNDSGLKARLAKNNRQILKQRYSREYIWEEYIKFYKQL